MSRVCDRLIEVFMVDKPRPEEWRKLLAFSEEWNKIRPHFFKRCKSRADAEDNPKKKGDLLKLARRLKEVRLMKELNFLLSFHFVDPGMCEALPARYSATRYRLTTT